MQSSNPPKFSLDTLMSTVLPSLDMNVPVDDAPKKFKRSRPPPGAAAPASAPAQTPPYIHKAPLSADMVAAAAAAFRSDVAAPSPAAPSLKSTSTSGAAAATAANANKSKSKWNRKRKAGKQGNSGAKTTNPDLNHTASTLETAGSTTHQSSSDNNKKSRIYQNAKHPSKNKPVIELDADEKTKKWVRLHRKDPQMITRNLDGTPDEVGVSRNKDDEDDFSTLLLKHVEQSNKMLQRDLELQSKKMLEEQKLQAKLLASQAAGFMDPLRKKNESSAGQPSQPSLEQQPETQMDKQGQMLKTGGKPFVPWKDCTYFLKGHCPKGESCTFKHDLEARNAQLFKPLPEDSRKARGVCKFEKSGSCTKGDLCLFSHDLSDEPCVFYHLMGVCERGALCKFGHQPITPEQLQQLRDNRNKTS